MKATPSLSIRLLSHNIRYATSSPFRGERPWADRKQRLINQLQYHSRHNSETFICLQEVLHVQLEDIVSGLNSSGTIEWAYVGVGRDDGRTAGEYAPIFYRPAVWQLEHFQTVWLSETPWKPSKGWDAASTRIVTIGVFKHRTSRKTVLAMSTHLDDQGSTARYEAAKLILGQVDYYMKTSEFAGQITGCFLAGDFNSEDQQEAYKVLTGPDSPLADSRAFIDPTLRYGNENTYTGFGYESVPEKRIDYILVGLKGDDDGSLNARGYAVLANLFEDGVFFSDHRAVVVDSILR